MKCFYKPLKFLPLLALFAACKPDVSSLPTPVVKGSGTVSTSQNEGKSSVDFSRFISIGDSQTAGYANDGLYLSGQQASFPALMAKQMVSAGGGAFAQPLFGASEANGSGYLTLSGYNADGIPNITRVTSNLAVRGTINVANYGNVTLYNKYAGGVINNYGVSGIRLTDINNTQYGNLNGYFERLLPNNAPNNTTSYLDFVTAKPYTFFSCWLGNNDVLQYATAGAASGTVTDKDVFQNVYQSLITKLTANGQKGVVATIPDVTALPFFNTITVNSLLQTVQKVNPTVKGLYIKASTGSGPVNQTYTVRLATTSDLILLNFSPAKIGQLVSTSAGMQPYGLSPAAPIDNQYVLDQNEVFIIKNFILSYNTAIKSIATAKGLAVFDANAYLNELKQSGLTVNGIKFTADFMTGGVFSLDGIHLTPKGYALEANQFIGAINKTYGTVLLPVDVSQIN